MIRCGSGALFGEKNRFFLAAALCCAPGALRAQPSPELATPRTEKQIAGPAVSWWSRRTRSRREPATTCSAAAAAQSMPRSPRSSCSIWWSRSPPGSAAAGFCVHYAARAGKLEAYDGREAAPAAARPDRFLGADGRPLDGQDAVISGKSAGVPGLLRLLELAHRKHGKLSWPSCSIRRSASRGTGFPISPRLHALVAADRFLARDEMRGVISTCPTARPSRQGRC